MLDYINKLTDAEFESLVLSSNKRHFIKESQVHVIPQVTRTGNEFTSLGVLTYKCPYCGENVEDHNLYSAKVIVLSGTPVTCHCIKCNRALVIKYKPNLFLRDYIVVCKA